MALVAEATVGFPMAMDYFKDYTYLGVTPEDYIELIEKALSENTRELEKKRKAYGLSHSWENNVNEIYNCIIQVEKASA